MAKKLDVAKLFMRWKPPMELRPWKTDEAMLDAVRDGKKAMMSTGVPLKWLKSGSPQFMRILELAHERDLAVVLDAGTSDPKQVLAIDIHVLQLEQAWRISALRALHETALVDRGWSAAAETQDSVLRGYTKRQRKKWFAWWKERQATWGGMTVYAILSDTERRVVREVGGRAFPAGREVTLFYRNHDLIRRDGFRRVPKGMHVARVTLLPRAWRELFQPPYPSPLVTTTRPAAFVNERLKSAIQFLAPRGWRR